ncbi:MAG: hypothetical protein AAFY41_17815, partial [Bacteroidota bacterium]
MTKGFAHWLGVELLTDEQRKILLSIRDRTVTNVQAAHGVGKSFLAGTICVLWWVFACQGLCITTAPTKRQVEEILWREVRTGYDRNRLKLGGERGKTFVRVSANAYAF